MSKQEIDIRPDTHVIDSLIHTEITTAEALSELVDNSFDADARVVRISFDRGVLEILDEGRGCDDIGAMLALGKHRPSSTTKMGRYGVGLKNATCGLGDWLEIETKRARRTVSSCELSWGALRASGNWKLDAEVSPNDTDEHGTCIRIGRMRGTARWSVVGEELAYRFAPALWSGRQIFLLEEEVDAWSLPAEKPEIDVEQTGDERGFRLRLWMLEKPQDKSPFVYAYEHRIMCGNSEPCGEFSPGARFFAFVELFGTWPLLKHKDGLRKSKESEWLYEELHDACLPVFERLAAHDEQIETERIEQDLAEAFGYRIGRENRDPAKHEAGAVAPANTEARRRVAAKVSGKGDVKERPLNAPRRGFGYRIEPLPGGIVGSVDVNGKRISVTLNSEHAYVAACKQDADIRSLKALVVLLVSNQQAVAEDDGQRWLKFDPNARGANGRFIDAVSDILGRISAR